MGNLVKTIQQQGKSTRLVISERNWLESAAVDQLLKTTELHGICCGVGMPDLHPGKGQPIGAAFMSEKFIYPHLVGSDIGCGMGLWKLDIAAKKVKLDKWEKKLVGLDELWDGDCHERLKQAGLECDVQYAVHNEKLGTIGGGNHFSELQQLHEVFDSDLLSPFGMDKQSVVLLVHSGSRGLGQAILREHTDNYAGAPLDVNSLEGKAYLAKHNYAQSWAVENRSLITERFIQALSVRAERVLDISHNTVLPMAKASVSAMKAVAFDGGVAAPLLEKTVESNSSHWIHRKGASPTDKGIVMIPGSRGSLSYLVKPREEAREAIALGGFSLAHGAGRKWKRSDAKSRLEKRYSKDDLLKTRFGSRVICKNKGLVYEEAPQAYKDIDRVVADLVDAGMIDLIASFKPLITYKTRRV